MPTIVLPSTNPAVNRAQYDREVAACLQQIAAALEALSTGGR